MKIENVERVERLTKKYRKLKDIHNILVSYVSCAGVTVAVHLPYSANGEKTATIEGDEIFNALFAKMVETEIKNIEEIMKSL